MSRHRCPSCDLAGSLTNLAIYVVFDNAKVKEKAGSQCRKNEKFVPSSCFVDLVNTENIANKESGSPFPLSKNKTTKADVMIFRGALTLPMGVRTAI